jgi:hypothetical protein
MAFWPRTAASRRGRSSLQRRALLRAALSSLLLAALAYVAYEAGRAHWRAEVDRLQRANAQLEALDRERVQRLVEALSRIEVLEARNTALEQELARRVPDVRMAELVELLKARLADGIPIDRLASILRSLTRERDCVLEEQGVRVFVRVPLASDRRNHASLAGGLMSVRLEGEPARDGEGRPEAWYDPAAAVRLLLVTVDGRRLEYDETLPFTRSLVLGQREYRLLVQPDERRGFVRIVVESCSWP